MLVPLAIGAYEARSIIAEAQRCVNLYPEHNPQDSPVPATHYPTPGLTSIDFDGGKPCRWQYQASDGNLYSVFGDHDGSSLYVSMPSSTELGIGTNTLIGTFNSPGPGPVSMADNGIVLIIVDGTPYGWVLDLSDSTNFGQITDTNFRGATRVDYLDTFFIFNEPDTKNWYISLSNASYDQFTGNVGGILTGSIISAGNGSYGDGLFAGTALTGGAGSGGIATITVSGNLITNVEVTSPGIGYAIGDVLSAALAGTAIATGVISGVGSGYTNGNYPSQALTGGGGTGATANIVVASGAVSSVTIVNAGVGYAAGQVLSASIPGGSGFTYTIDTTTGSGFTYGVDTISGQAIDPIDFATKSGYPDDIVTLIVMNLYIWLIGAQTSEIWFNAGAADFPFQIFPGVFIEHGCVAPHSIAKQDLSIYWLSQDRQGQCIVLKGNNFAAQRISTFAIENEFSKYSKISDALGFTYQQKGHVFYVLTFPTADKTWVFDEATRLWHEQASLQFIQEDDFVIDGNLHRVIYNSCGVCGGLIYVGDDLGNVWQLDPSNFTENGHPISRIRSFPHLLNNQKRVFYKQFVADMETGTDDSTVTGDDSSSDDPPVVNLRWSDDRGKTYGSYVRQSLGALGQYLASVSWNRLGMARDRVFELSWSVPTETALNGAWVDTETAGS